MRELTYDDSISHDRIDSMYHHLRHIHREGNVREIRRWTIWLGSTSKVNESLEESSEPERDVNGGEGDHGNGTEKEGTVKARRAALVTSDIDVRAEKRDVDTYYGHDEDGS